jgi:3-methyladenine DNA glycosylase AlkD
MRPPPRRQPRRGNTRASTPAATSAALAARVDALLRPHAIPARRAFLTASYAPTQLPWLGVPVPAIREVVRDLDRTTHEQSAAAVLRLALALARKGSLEGRQVGYELLGRRADALALVNREAAERLGRGNDNWASVDAFATTVTGPAWRLGYLRDRDLLAWAHSRDPWWRRAAVVSTVALNTASRGGRGDSRRTLLICRTTMANLTPMMARALSWALRSLAPHDPAAVLAFLERHRVQLPAAVTREVETKLRTGKKTATSRSRSVPDPRSRRDSRE